MFERTPKNGVSAEDEPNKNAGSDGESPTSGNSDYNFPPILPEGPQKFEEVAPERQEVRQEISRADAEFRRKFANSMLGLVTGTVCLALGALLIASYAAMTDSSASHTLAKSIVETIKEIFPVAFSGIMGVFGTIVGFYFAKGDTQN